ncbi:MAG: PKD domain protein [Methanocella sp. PtaU1.Bin125]|nr:MAG: PKD domain protein [Methanocella sp. PtaU1.Bin125]
MGNLKILAVIAVILLIVIPGVVSAADITVSGSILPAAPDIDFTGTPTSGARPLTVAFTATNTGGAADTWAWDFNNDGTIDSTLQNPSYTYSAGGTYTVKLTATNAGGSDTETKDNYITVLANLDFTIAGSVDSVPATAIFAKEPNAITVTNVKNMGTDPASNIVVSLYASDVGGGETPVVSTTIASLAAGAQTTLNLVDPTVRSLAGGTVTYTAKVDPDNLIAETNEANNNAASSAKSLVYNGYKGKRYWEGGSDLTTKKTYDLNGDLLYYTQPASAYKGVGWTTRTETWDAANLPVPSGATIENVYLYVSYNWDTTPGGVPSIATTFNGNTIALGTPYTDQSNFGTYASYKYGLYPAIDVTSLFVNGGTNTLVMTPNTGNSNALYPSTLVVVYSDPTKTRKQIFINEEFDYLAYSLSSYGTTMDEATAYVPFSGMTIDTGGVQTATLYSFAASAGPNEGNLLFNGATVATNAWQGTASTASAQTFNVKAYLTATGNEAGIQETQSGGMGAIQQILVVEYTAAPPVAGFSATPTSGDAPLTVAFTDASTGIIASYAWDFNNDGTTDSTLQNPGYSYDTPGIYTVKLAVTGPGGSDDEVKTSYIMVKTPAPVADFTYAPASGAAPLTVAFTSTSSGVINSYAWDFNNDGTTDSTLQNPSWTYNAAGTYSVKLTVTGPDYSDEEFKTNIITVGTSSISVEVTPASVDFGTMSAGIEETGSAQVAVTTDGGTAWSVDAAANNGGYMKSGANQLASPFQLANGGGAFQAMTSAFTGFMTGSANEDRTDTANLKQAISAGDQPGDYSITLTFTGAFG